MARQTFDSVLSHLRDGEDEVAVFTFDASLHERHPFTADLARLKDALSDFEPFGTTSLYDATAATSESSSASTSGRPITARSTTAGAGWSGGWR